MSRLLAIVALDRTVPESHIALTRERSRAASARNALASGCVIQCEPRAVVENSLYGCVDFPRVHPLPRVTMQGLVRLIRRWCSFNWPRRRHRDLWQPLAFDACPVAREALRHVASALALFSGEEMREATGSRIGSADFFHVGYSRTCASGPT